MGLLGTIGKVIGKIFFGSSKSSSSNSTRSYNYEPDRVRAAEIERDTKLRLAEKEAERIELMRDAQLELIKAQTMSELAIEKARAEGMAAMANQIVILQERMLEIAQKRIAIIEEGSLPIIREIENFYNEVGERIQANNDEYNTKKLPQLLKILEQYEEGTAQHKIYSAQIMRDMDRQGKFIEQQLEKVSERQNLVLQSFLSSKEKILEQTGQITKQIAEGYLKRYENLLPQGQSALQALPGANFKQLPSADR